jgi:hypothetical protein
VSLVGVEAPYLSSAYRKPVYLYFTSLDGVASSASTSAVRRYAAGEYADAYAQYTASNRTFKFEAIERPADCFFRVSPVKRFYEYERLYDKLVYSKTVSPLLASQILTYRPRFRYVSYSVSDYTQVYDSVGYVRTVSPLLLLQVFVYRPRRRYASYPFVDYSAVYSVVGYVKAVFAGYSDVGGLYDGFVAVPVAKAYLAYEKPYEAVRYVKTLSPVVFTVFGYRPRRRYVTYSAIGYERTYDGVRAVKAVVMRLDNVVDVYVVSKSVNRSAAFAEFVVPYESFEARPVYVYQADSYEELYMFNYVPTVRYYNVYFVNVYRYANVYDLERLYESFRYERKSAGYSYTSYERIYESSEYRRYGYGYTSYEGLY